MAYQQAYSAYKETGVKTASQGKLIVMLYDEAVRQLAIAVTLFQNNDKVAPQNIEKLHNCIVKVQDIITELQVSLDMDKGGEIASNLMALYVFFNQQLLDANITQNKEKIISIKEMMVQLRDAWEQASEKATAAAPAPQMRSSIDING